MDGWMDDGRGGIAYLVRRVRVPLPPRHELVALYDGGPLALRAVALLLVLLVLWLFVMVVVVVLVLVLLALRRGIEPSVVDRPVRRERLRWLVVRHPTSAARCVGVGNRCVQMDDGRKEGGR